MKHTELVIGKEGDDPRAELVCVSKKSSRERSDVVLPKAWPNSVAEQHSVRDFLTPFVYSILTDSILA